MKHLFRLDWSYLNNYTYNKQIKTRNENILTLDRLNGTRRNKRMKENKDIEIVAILKFAFYFMEQVVDSEKLYTKILRFIISLA